MQEQLYYRTIATLRGKLVVFRAAWLAMLLGVCTSPSMAMQPPPRGPDPFFDALRELHQDNPDKEILELLRDDSVRTAIKLVDDDWQSVQHHHGQSINAVMKVRDDNRGKQVTKVEIKKQLTEALRPLDEKAFQILREKSQFQRLLGIYVQARGFRAAATNVVAEQIGLADEQLDEFRQTRSKLWFEKMLKMRETIGDDPRNRKRIGRMLKEIDEQIDKALSDKLNEEQRNKLEALKGEPFPIPDDLFDFRSRRRGGPSGERGSGERNSERESGKRVPSEDDDRSRNSRDRKPHCD